MGRERSARTAKTGRRLRTWLVERLLLPLARRLVLAHLRTLRLQVEGDEALSRHLESGGRVVLAGWHQRWYGAIDYFRWREPVVMVSRSRDGDLMARLAESLGCTAVRGSTSKGGGAALLAMTQLIAQGRIGAHLVDGPSGPARRTKPGVVRLAQRARASILPVYVGYARRLEAGSWDRFQIPLPFSRVLIRFGRLIEVPAELKPRERDAICADLDREFADGYARADTDVKRWRSGR